MMKQTAERLDRTGTLIAFGSIVGTLGLWLLVFFLAPVPANSVSDWARLAYAVSWIGVAALFALTMGVEAVAHERLQSDAFNPLAGHETKRLRINQRYLQNTVEQFALFAVAMAGLAMNGAPDPFVAARAVTASAVVWIIARYLFWIGYHRSATLRGMGMGGLALPMIILLWLAARFGWQHLGIAGAIIPLLLFAAIEAVLFTTTRSSNAD